jgi:serine/threonine-protein kinase
MKHLSDTPRPPSLLRPEIPPDLDMVVLRALAKSPEDRFQTAEEMDAELERVAAGVGVTAETADAATAVLSGTALASAPTAIVPPRRPPAQMRPSYRYAEPPPRRRPIWPWLLALLLVVLAGVAGWYAFGKIQNSLSSSGGVPVPNVVPLREDLAVAKLNEKGLGAIVHRQPHETVKIGLVFEQGTAPGVRVDKGNAVDIYVSLGPPKVEVPNVMGKSRDDAIAALTDAKLKFKVLQVFSKEDPNTVVAQSPTGGHIVTQGSIVHINVSKGLEPLTVPNVVGQLYDNAAGQLQGVGFAVARRDVESSQPKDTVIDQDPGAGADLARGGTVTLFVSKGPKQATIPDVTSQDEDSATQTLEGSGFSVDVQDQDVTDPAQDGIVLSQDPPGGKKAKPGTTVTIVVGRLVPVP